MHGAVHCHVHVARERRKESLQPFIRGRICKISDKDLGRGVRPGDADEGTIITYFVTGRFFDFVLRDGRHAVLGDWGGLGVRHGDELGGGLVGFCGEDEREPVSSCQT